MQRKTKLTAKKVLAFRKQLSKKLERETKRINNAYHPIIKQFLKENSPVKEGKVYELAAQPDKMIYTPKRAKRFAVYTIRPSYWDDIISIAAGGWWLNADGVPVKWVTYVLTGVSNPVRFVLSKDQTRKPHPQAHEENYQERVKNSKRHLRLK